MRLSPVIAGLGLAAALFAGAPAQAQQGPLDVPINQATQVQLRAPAGSVIVANPRIADVAVTDARTLFITGKSYGLTEIIAVDSLGRPLFRRQVIVSPGQTGSVRVWRGGEAVDVTCGTRCAPAVAGPAAP